MADDPGRSPKDINWTRSIAGAFTDRVDGLAREMSELPPATERHVFEELVSDVEHTYAVGPTFLSQTRYAEVSQDFKWLIYLLAYYDAVGAHDMLAVRDLKNTFGAPTLVDVFSDSAVSGLSSTIARGPRQDQPQQWRSFRNWTQDLQRSNEVLKVDRLTGVHGFLTLFVDTLAAVARIFRAGGSTTVHFTVDSMNFGYQLEYYPQYRYSPKVFGSNLSRPVSAQLPTGPYYFQGRKTGLVIKDPPVHFAGPSNTSTVTAAF